MEKIRKVAFFDIDGTVMNTHLPRLLMDYFFKNYEYRGRYSKKLENQINELEFARKRYKNYYNRAFKSAKEKWKVENYSEAFSEYSQMFYPVLSTLFEGYSEYEVKQIANEVLHEYRYEAYAYSLELIKKLKSEDFELIAISGSPQFLVDAFVKEFGFDLGIGGGFILENGTWQESGEETWRNKDIIAKRLINNGDCYDKHRIVSVGDTIGDLELLNLADVKVIINPQFELLKKISKGFNFVSVMNRKDTILIETRLDKSLYANAVTDSHKVTYFQKGVNLEDHFRSLLWQDIFTASAR